MDQEEVLIHSCHLRVGRVEQQGQIHKVSGDFARVPSLRAFLVNFFTAKAINASGSFSRAFPLAGVPGACNGSLGFATVNKVPSALSYRAA